MLKIKDKYGIHYIKPSAIGCLFIYSESDIWKIEVLIYAHSVYFYFDSEQEAKENETIILQSIAREQRKLIKT